MRRLTHWKCYTCKRMKKLPEEIDRADLRAVCRECKSLAVTVASTDATTSTSAPAVVRRRYNQRIAPRTDRSEPQ